MIKLSFAEDEESSCKTCIWFNDFAKFCMKQESNTGNNPNPTIPNPEAWTCEMHRNRKDFQQ